ncbi:2-oxoglutarate and iron-dependent oxygenase domain-containing protein 2-like [Bolinopsis microptera]|uniref:2-oxoglutarate and iron-dependent oxygenase domain-containing protein 2-like n=1 Tax=Bolinopsis microptera TaxID=2820187 RepID=UPI003078C925
MNKFYRCECFASHNVFIAKYRLHVKYQNEEQFWNDYGDVLKERGMTDRGKVLEHVKTEVQRRLNLDDMITRNTEYAKKNYTPLYPQIRSFKREWFDPKFIELAEVCADRLLSKSQIIDRYLDTIGAEIYTIRAFTPQFCSQLVEELDNFNEKILQRSRPNTMNTSGVIVEEFGLLDFVNQAISNLLSPISSVIFPEWYGSGTDSHKSFSLRYELGKDTELAYHYDNAEITFNFCLGNKFSGAEVYFTHMTSEEDKEEYYEADHVPGVVMFHRARQMHGTLPLLSGSRYNLLTWLRSSSVRNKMCPMCRSVPKLVPSSHMGDGFTIPTQ